MSHPKAAAHARGNRVHPAVSRGLVHLFLHPPRRIPWATPRSALGAAYRRISLQTTDGIRLAGWHVPCPNARAVAVLAHGYSSCRETMLPYLRILRRHGFAAVLCDFRSHGWSTGDMVTLGHKEHLDLEAAVRAARMLHPDLPVMLVGESMGAATALKVASDDPDIVAVVADCAFARLDDPIANRLRITFGEPLGARLVPGAAAEGARRLGVDPASVAPEEWIARIAPRPVLLVHGEADRLIPVEHAHRLHRAGGDSVELWTVPGAAHARSIRTSPSEYARHLDAFVDRVLGPDPAGGTVGNAA
ncbi:MAG: alpha/beta hydrolase [Armatimonadota bacterium]